ncbi:MAG: acetyl-CoA carboxylase biotin carboxyl carrier protein [Myxococcaceae bacterium]|nr:acetyl-CoA carboxylase biotin carboxyl carrier protein [Myxococcaceae bacterium]
MAIKRKAVRTVESPSAATAAAKAPRPSSTSLDVEVLREIVQLLETSEVTRFSWQRGDERLLICRGPAGPTVVHAAPLGMHAPVPMAAPFAAPAPTPAAAPAPAAAVQKPGQLVTSPFVGTFYRAPAPDQPNFVELGALVKKGQVLCIVEAMKLMNEIESEMAGKVTEVLVENGQAVEFGQALFRIEPV